MLRPERFPALLAATGLAIFIAVASPALADWPAPVRDGDYRPVDRAEAELGQLLFYDPILSGNRNIACATCHHPRFGTSDGVSLALGEGGIGLGPERIADPANLPEQRLPRNAPALFNLGAYEFTTLFHDGRIESDPSRPGGLRTPLGGDMISGFSGVLSAQTMFPVLSGDEMAGHYSENDISQAVRLGRITGAGGAWDLITDRVVAHDDYSARFRTVYPEIAAGRAVDFTDISNAIAAFMAFEWRSDNSAFDKHLRGETPLTGAALTGADLFYGDAGCSACHSGIFQTDHRFHAMGVPQIGPGKAARFERHARDDGRFRVTGDEADRYAFRTPSLRNVTLTAPYGHDGAYGALDVFLAAHVRDGAYDRSQAVLPRLDGARDWRALEDAAERDAIAAARVWTNEAVTEADLAALEAFLGSLTDMPERLGVPDAVPSGLEVPR